ncbi:hypothetical protein [Larkinella punicea]|uniref:Uncharacterized protein n=1 Tax=Larkinella punicea TaxID=2315727 RepID=A0A368JH84_9BACT|nr:hypothetical protein [Larkinella punicea]RCR67028.1 hypothetical protein DUE52_23510 [Larkinella punicea]
MSKPLDAQWADDARLTFDRLPIDAQAALIKQFPTLAAKYAELWAKRPAGIPAVGSVSHMQLPDWNIWLRMDIDYVEDEMGAVLFINELTELTAKELEQSVAAARQMPGRINPPNL